MKRSSSYRYHRRSKFSFVKTLFKIVLISIFLALIILLLTPTPHFKDGFKNLKELQTYANKTNEQTPMENADTLRPEFTKYYQSQIPTFSQKIKNKIKLLLYLVGVKEKPVWSVSFFKTILENVNKSREAAGYKDNLIYKVQTTPESKFIIFGCMQGAFHSLVRSLTKIKELGIIGEDLKMCNPNNYIIFMGDVIDRSPFTLETLSTVLKLIEVNPQNVIYMRGNHESKDYWQEHTLKTELQIRAAYLSKDIIPLQKEVDTFFNSLPLAIYLTIPNTQNNFGPNNFVRISEHARSENTVGTSAADTSKLLNEAKYADFLTKQQTSNLDFLVIKEPTANCTIEVSSDIAINIKASIHNEKKRKTYQKTEGLRLLAPDMGAVAWTLLSCPTIVYQKALGFYDDAFVILSAADDIENWEIDLYSHDVRTKDPFKETKFNFISGLDVNSAKTKISPTLQAQKPQAQQTAPSTPVQQTQGPQVNIPTQQVTAQLPKVITQTQAPQAQTPQVQQTVSQPLPATNSTQAHAQIGTPVQQSAPAQQALTPQAQQALSQAPVVIIPAEQHPQANTPMQQPAPQQSQGTTPTSAQQQTPVQQAAPLGPQSNPPMQ